MTNPTWLSIAAMILLLPALPAKSGDVADRTSDPVDRLELLPPTAGNPRNDPGDFVRLRDGRIMLLYTHKLGPSDGSRAYLAARFSRDQGRTWTKEDVKVLSDPKRSVSVSSCVRLPDDRLALFYGVKESLNYCMPMVRTSADEGQTWSAPTQIIPDSEKGYYVLNNDRVVVLKSGRLVVPVARHNASDWLHGTTGESGWTHYGNLMCYLSDDHAETWYRSCTVLTGKRGTGPKPSERGYGHVVMLQEPGVVKLTDGRLMMWARTNLGCQYASFSQDEGETWIRMQPTDIVTSKSPASIKRIPSTGDLLLVWNNLASVPESWQAKRSPLTVAISPDEGKTWKHVKNLYDDPGMRYCYTAIHFTPDEHVLLLHHASPKNQHLGGSNVTRFPVDWLYQ